jgi:uncharacterized membrane protein HdeD (DUF308 family)
MSFTTSFSHLLIKARDNASFWKKALFTALGILLGINLFLHPHHAHFAMETTIGFWAVFGVVVSVIMVLVLKKIIYPLINKPEAFYDRSE